MFNIQSGGSGIEQWIRLVDDEARTNATIFPQVGFNCASFVIGVGEKEFDVHFSEPGFPSTGKATANGTPILAPFPNRIREGRFRFGGRDFSLPANHGPNAIHGFVFDQPWRVTRSATEKSAAVAVGEFQLSVDRPAALAYWPSDFWLLCEFRLAGFALEMRFEVENVGDSPMPFGLGTHPYFRFPLTAESAEADCTIECPADSRIALIDCLPTGVVEPVTGSNDLRKPTTWSGRNLDDVYAKLQPRGDGNIEHSLVDRRAGVRLKVVHPSDFDYCVLYVPPHRKAICIEPYTCVTDAVNLTNKLPDHGLRILEPGERAAYWIRHEVELL